MTHSQDLHGKIKDLLEKHDGIHAIYQRAEDSLAAEMGSIDWSQTCPEDSENTHKYCEHMYQSIRQAMLVLLCSCLETGIDLIGNEFVESYGQKIAKKKKGEGNLKTRLRVLDEAGISIGLGQHKHNCDIAEALRLIRNCLVHAAGWVAKSTEKQKLEEAIQTLKKEAEKINTQFLEERDGQLYLYAHILALTNSTSYDLIWDLYGTVMHTHGGESA